MPKQTLEISCKRHRQALSASFVRRWVQKVPALQASLGAVEVLIMTRALVQPWIAKVASLPFLRRH